MWSFWRSAFWLVVLALASPALAAPAAWVIRDADTEITLFGTIHALPKGVEWLSPSLAARLDAADTLVLEAVMPDDPAVLAPVINRIGMPPGIRPLAERVPADALPRLTAAAVTAGVPMAALDRMDSWLVAMTLSNAALTGVGIDAAAGVEPTLTARAKARNVAIIGLETAEQQLGFFDALPAADQAAMLLATIDDVGTAKRDFDALLALWQAGDIEAIARDFDRETRATPLLRQRLLVARNVRWADWIAGVMRRPGKLFIAVGAGHLGGADGLLALLQARQLTPEPVR
jgi:uncharacterized protein YbaP (TraB family)